MEEPLPTRDEEALDRARHRLFMGVVGLAFAAMGTAGLVASLSIVAWGTGGGALALSVMLFVGGSVVAWRGWTTDTRPDPGLPTFEQLPATDPRKARSLADRRQTWRRGLAVWVAGWATAAAGYFATEGMPPTIRLLAFLLPSIGGVAIGSSWVRRHNGTDSFPWR